MISKLKKSSSRVPAVSRALKVLEALARDPYEKSLSELSAELGIPAASLWRILKVLTESQYTIFDRRRHTYRLGFKFMYMGSPLLAGAHYRSEGREYLRRLVEATGETAELDVRIRDQLVLIDQVSGANAVYLYSHPGSAMPYFHATAPGKIYFAHMGKEKLLKAVNKLGLPRLTPHTIQDIGQLEKEIEKIRIDGYAVDIEEMREGVARVAAPVHDLEDRVVACLAIACPAFRMNDPNTRYRYGTVVKQIAGEMTGQNRED